MPNWNQVLGEMTILSQRSPLMLLGRNTFLKCQSIQGVMLLLTTLVLQKILNLSVT